MMPPGLLPFGPNPFLMQQLAAASGLRQNFHQNQQRAGLLGLFLIYIIKGNVPGSKTISSSNFFLGGNFLEINF
jgi:hypothetical protein